jgi:predicted DCC family thiol-disulfide oxidoreductase YuxK
MNDTCEAGLPGPEDRPEADVVIYDGQCPLCRNAVRRLNRIDRRGRLAFLPLQDPEVGMRFPDLRQEELQSQLHVIDKNGRPQRGAMAVRYLSRRLPGLWVLAPLLHIPGSGPFWRWLYGQVARRR